MRNTRVVKAATLAVGIGLGFASAESLGQDRFFEFPLAVDGVPIDEFLLDEDAPQILSTLEEIDVDECPPQPRPDRRWCRDALIPLLQRIEEAGFVPREEVPAALTGIGGFSTQLVLRAFLFKEAHKVQGRIRDYIYVDATKSGHLAVDVKTLYFASAADRDAGKLPKRTELLHWDIEVDSIYEVHERGTDYDDPFPYVDLELPTNAITSIWDPTRDLKYKLHAKGPGIKVRHVYRKIDSGTMQLLPSTDYRYTTTYESCIDLLFNPYPPESELPPQKGFCLGRCKHPDIINTGG
jgi:hypothetical protein